MDISKGKLFFGFLCLFLLIHSAAAAQVPPLMTEPSGGTIGIPSKAEILGEFMDLALDLKNPSSGHSVTKWARPSVSVKVVGDTDERSRYCLAEDIGEINNLTGSVNLRITSSEASDIDINFIPLEEFPLRVTGYSAGSEGDTSCVSQKGFLHKCSIWVPTTGVDEGTRCTILLHEITHAMGLFGHSEHGESILFQGTTARGYSPLDREVLRLLYNQALSPGFTEETVRGYFS